MKNIVDKITYTWNHAGFQKYVKNTGWMFISKIFILALNLFVSIFIAKHLGPEQYGTFSFIISFVSIAGFTLFSVDSLIMKILHEHPDQTKEILGSGLMIKLINGIFTVLAATVAGILFANTASTTWMIFVYATFTIFQSISVIDFYFRIHAQNKPVSILGTTVTIIMSVVKVGIVYYNLPIIYLLASYILDQILGGIGYIYLYKKYIGNIFDIRPVKKIVIDLIVKSWPFTLSALATAVYIRVDQVFIKVLLGSESVGFYAIDVRFSEVWFIIAELICISLLPAILNAEKHDRTLYLGRSKKLYSLLFYSSIAICGSMFIIAPLLIDTLYGTAYMPSIYILRTYIWSIVGYFMLTALNQFLLAENKFKTILSVNIIGMILSVTLNYMFIPILGITGAIVANILSYTLPVMIILIFFKDMEDQRTAFIRGIFKPFSSQ